MAIDNPHIVSRPLVSATGTLTAASQIQTTAIAGDSDAQSDINTINTTLTRINNFGVAWNFDDGITEDPPLQTFRFNNVDPEQATIIYLDKFSVAGRFDELLESFATGGFIYLQDRTNAVNNFLFRTTAALTPTGGANGWYIVNIEFLRSQSTITAVNGDRFSFIFIPITGTGGRDLPNMFLNEIEEIDTTEPTNKIDTEAVVRFWFRSELVNNTNVNNPGVGLIFAESNGDLSPDGDTYQDDTNHHNEFLYMSLNDSYIASVSLSDLRVVIKNLDGSIDQELPVETSFTNEGKFGLAGSNTFFRLTSGARGGIYAQYNNNQTIELFAETTRSFFDIPTVNEANVDLTRGVKNLSESRLSEDLQGKINTASGVSHDDQFKLDQLIEASSESASASLTGSDTVYFKYNSYSHDIADYFPTDFNTGLPPVFDNPDVVIIAVTHDYIITSIDGLEGGSANVAEIYTDINLIGDSQNRRFNVYRVTQPVTASATNFFVFTGTQTTITEINPSSLVKINRDNIEADFLTHIENTQGNTLDSQRLDALENKVSVLYPLAPDVDTLQDWSDIYVPQNTVQEVVITSGYDLIADFRGSGTRYESSGVIYDDTGTNVVTYTGLSQSTQRIFGFQVSAPADQTLLWVIDGAERIPFIDMTAAGNYRVNNYQQAQTASDPVDEEVIFLNPISGGTRIMTLVQNAVFLITDYPTGATSTSRRVQVNFDVLINGVSASAGHLQVFDVPETNTPQDRIEVTINIPLGPLFANRVVTVTVGYRFTFVDPEYRLILNLRNAPSDVTLSADDVALTRSYTPASTTTRVDDYQIITGSLGNYTFTGENELLVAFHPLLDGATINVVPVAVNSSGTIEELNDRQAPIPHGGFDDVEIPDTIEFRTVRADHVLLHSDLASLIADRSVQWAYGLARLRTVSTTHAVIEAIDLASGTTIGGQAVDFGRTTQDSQSFTASNLVNVNLPASTTLSSFIIIEVTWHTGVGTASDNDNRNYTEMGFVPAIINATDDEIILGGRGRGADNYGIEVKTSGLSGTSTSLTLEIINYNDTAGATLPTGSLITAVRFY